MGMIWKQKLALLTLFVSFSVSAIELHGSQFILSVLKEQTLACTNHLVSRINESGIKVTIKKHTLTGAQRVFNGSMEMVTIEDVTYTVGSKQLYNAQCIVGPMEIYVAKFENGDGTTTQYLNGAWINN